MSSFMPCIEQVSFAFSPIVKLGAQSYLWHNGATILAFYVAERHLGALMLIKFELWEVKVLDFVQSHCGGQVSRQHLLEIRAD